jgi:hypothetical protein
MILFLDFDGVLHPVDRREGCFSCLPALENALREFNDVEIVISSSWRLEFNLTQLRSIFSSDVARCVIDVTPDRATKMESIEPYRREREVDDWVDDWLRENGREYEPWLVLDDCEWMFSPSCTRLILVNSVTGFNESVAKVFRARMRSK